MNGGWQTMTKKEKKRMLVIASVTVVMIVIVATLSLVYSHFVDKLLTDETESYLTEVSSATSMAVENSINRYFEVLRTYSITFSTRLFNINELHADPLFDKKNEDNSYLRAIIGAANDQNVFSAIAIMDIYGNALTEDHGWTDLSYRSYFKTAISGSECLSQKLTDYYIKGEEINVFAVPIYLEGEIVGVVVGKVNNAEFAQTLSTEIFDGESFGYMISQDGTVAVKTGNEKYMPKTGENLFTSAEISEEDVMMIRNVIADKDAKGVIPATISDQQYYIGYNAIDNGEWIVLTLISMNKAHELTGSILALTIMCVVALFAVVLALVIYILVYQIRTRRSIEQHMAEFEQLAYVDSITGANTWNKLLNELPNLLKDYSVNYAVVSVDIDKFRAVNDCLGHAAGNDILKRFSEILGRNMREHDSFAHINSDLFYCLVSYKEESDLITFIENVINDTDYQITEMKLTLSFGVYRIGNRNIAFRVMCDRADLARRIVKTKKESAYEIFDAEMLLHSREEQAIEDSMEHALEIGEFKVYLQPKYSMIDTKKIVGAEALCRWEQDGIIIQPSKFIPLFEKNRFVLKLDYYMFEEVCRLQKLWINKGFNPCVISVNMSRVHLQESNFTKRLYDISRRYNVPTSYFEIEITESAAFENLEVISHVFAELKDYGFHISIDDFGTGYSSLNMLKDLSVDVLKIDRAFLLGAEGNKRACEIISHVISLALALKMKTICEGVETEEQAKLLKDLGCDMAQGYLYARPMPVSDYERLLYSYDNKGETQ